MMTSTQVEGSAVTATQTPLLAVLGQLGAAKEPDAVVPAPEQREPYLGLTEQLTLLVRRLELILPVAPEVLPVLEAATGLLTSPPERIDPGDLVELAGRIDRTASVMVQVGPCLGRCVSLAEPGRYLPSTSDALTAAARKIRGWYVEAILRAWKPAGGERAAIAAAERATIQFPKTVLKLYLTSNVRGIQGEINRISELRDELVGLKQAGGRPIYDPPGTDSPLNDVGLGIVAPAGRWGAQVRLESDLGVAIASWENNDPSVGGQVQALVRAVQAYLLQLSALILQEQLQIIIDDGLPLVGDDALIDRLTAYRDEVTSILNNQLHPAFHDSRSDLLGVAGKLLGAVMARGNVVADIGTANFWMPIQTKVKTLLITTAIVAAAALTSGAAAAAAGVLIGAFAGEAALLGVVTWTAIGSLAAEAIVFTMIDRFGREVAFGPAAVHESFWEEALWTAAMIGTLKVVRFGYGRLFAGNQAPSRLVRLGAVAAEQFTLAGFALAKTYIQSGKLVALGDLGSMMVDQLAMALVLHVAGGLTAGFTRRHPEAATMLPADLVQACDGSATDLATAVAKVKDNSATAIERQGLAGQVEQHFHNVMELIGALPDGPVRVEAEAVYRDLKAETELLGAEAGLDVRTAGPSAPAAFAPGEAGIVVYAEHAKPVLDKLTAERGGTLTEGPIDGVFEGTLPTGKTTFYAPSEAVTAPPPKPATIEATVNDATLEQEVHDLLAEGQVRLRQRFPNGQKANELLAIAGPANEVELLRLLAHADFAPAPGTSGITKAEIEAFARPESGPAREFAAAFGPRLAVNLIRKVTGGRTNFIPERSLDALARFGEMLRTAPDRTALTTRLMGLSQSDLLIELKLMAPPPPKLRPPTLAEGGVQRQTVQWLGIHEELLKPYAGQNLSLAEVRRLEALADIAQVLLRATKGDFRRANFTRAQQQLLMVKFDELCVNAGLNVLRTNKRYGYLVEWLVLESGTRNKVRYLKWNKVGIGVEHSSEPDFYDEALNHATEVKSNVLHEMDEARLRSVANEHYRGIHGKEDGTTGDMDNLPPGATFELDYFWAPADGASIEVMMQVFRQPGSRITRVRFGLGDWTPNVPIAAP